MEEYNPDDLIGRTFLLPKNEQGDRLRATIKRKVIETSKHLDNQYDNAIEKINFHLDVGQGRAEAIMSYVQILDDLDHQEQHEDMYKFRAITGHQGPLSPQDENYKVTEFRQPFQVQSHLEMPRILVQLGHTQRTWKLAPQTDPKWSPTWSLTRSQPIYPLSARDRRYSCQVSRAHRTHSRL